MPSRLRHVPGSARIVTIGVGFVLGFCACSHNPTAVSRELGARPRVEQLALSTAMDDAYGTVDFGFVSGKKVFVETKALAKTDVDYITSYVQKKVLAAGGMPVLAEQDAQLRLTSTMEVSGTDEIQKVGKDVVVGQFKGTLSVVDATTGQITKIHDLNSVAQTKRNRKGSTKIID